MTPKKPIAAKSKKPVVVAVSGYFNPLHVGHLDMIEKARKLGDKLVVIVNNDYQVKLKGSVPFMTLADRVRIIGALRDVVDDRWWVDVVPITDCRLNLAQCEELMEEGLASHSVEVSDVRVHEGDVGVSRRALVLEYVCEIERRELCHRHFDPVVGTGAPLAEVQRPTVEGGSH
jgi:cytidyltransferase-like protein